MADKIKKFIECLIPVTACNLHCHYCYVIQNNYRNNEIPTFKYSPEHVAKALSKKRMGGVCLINICGAGETLLSKELPDVVKALLKEGHYINITTNGTLTERFEEFIKFPKELLSKLHFSFSLHYIELKNRNLLDVFFNNVNSVRNAGASILVQFNMCDEYVPYLEDIKKICIKHIGTLPQIALTRDEQSSKIKIYSKLTQKEYLKLGDPFDSPLYKFTNKNFMVKQKHYCYAGAWSFSLNLITGEVRRCYFEKMSQNWFEDIDKPISLNPVGHNCGSPYCINSSHFMALGTIPEIECPTYSELRNRQLPNGMFWQTQQMSDFLNTKLYFNNKRYLDDKKNNFIENIFSIRSESSQCLKNRHRVMTILGLKFKFKIN